MKRFFGLSLCILILFSIILVSCASSGAVEETGRTAAEDSVDFSSRDDGAAESPAPAGSDVPVEEPSSGESAPAESSFGLKAADESEAEMPMMFEDEEGMEYAPSATAADHRSSAPSSSGLKAGYSDDNRQYGYFLRFLEEYGEQVTPLELDIAERITLSVTDSEGKPVHGARIAVTGRGVDLEGLTHADGTWQFNPPVKSSGATYTAEITPGPAYPGLSRTVEIDRNGLRNRTIKLETERVVPEPIPLDIVFVMDTTGSMGEEIERLKNTIQIIHLNLTNLSIPAELRFGMVLYKDVDDEYRTRKIPLTSDLNQFQAALDRVTASGGGDTPEDLEAALDVLLNDMTWNPKAIQLAYIITDAPPHLDYSSAYTCADAAVDARTRGLKIYGIGTGGLDLQGEYILRQIAQYTSARYIFLTYGSETGESSGGAAGSVSHHTGSNWNADKLESIIIRFAREEISFLSDRPLTDDDPWFEADKIDTEEAEETLGSLFDQAVEQLLDYSTFPVSPRNPLAVLPFRLEGAAAEDSAAGLAATAEYFNEHFILSAGRSERLSLAERKEIGQILSELEFQNTGLTDEASVGKIGELLNAEVLISGNLFLKSGKYELFLKLLRTETGEVLSVTRAVIDTKLGL